jgi:hypothetical protein
MSATTSVTADTAALTSLGIELIRPTGAAQVLLQETRVVTIEQRADEPAIEIRRAEEPIGDREGQPW